MDGEDFAVDAADIAEVLGDGAHLVGHSYGGVVSLLAASIRPEAVFSLTVIEPPAFGLVRDQPPVAAFIDAVKELIATDPTPDEFLPKFIRIVGGDPGRLPSPLPPALVQAARVQLRGRWPWEAEIPLDLLAATVFPKLVVSGNHSRIFDAVCDVLEQRLPAARAVVPGAGHSVPLVGAAFNQHLTALWTRAESAPANQSKQ
ncbi:hypothetical protein GCM10010530_19520 [Kribbella aluminosa]